MRLINARTLELESFAGERNLPRYAILSHRWVDGEEVSFKDLTKQRNKHLSGWLKITRCCSQAMEDDLGYAWVDTCCIDKSSSAELSEAINSMFRWYSNSHVCYAYLSDVRRSVHAAEWQDEFIQSSWFTRSWTLQELLAPRILVFYNCEWLSLGPRQSLSDEIAEATNIHLSALNAEKLNLSDWSIAQRMSWASQRQATRVEDVAYSLLGIFDVNMPLLYGEGEKAFRRLQEEIIRQSHDHTIFAWYMEHGNSSGLLALSPANFKFSRNVMFQKFQKPTSYNLTNVGLSIHLPLEMWLPDVYWAGLNCTTNGSDQLGILLRQDHQLDGSFARTCLSLPVILNFGVDTDKPKGSPMVDGHSPATRKRPAAQTLAPGQENALNLLLVNSKLASSSKLRYLQRPSIIISKVETSSSRTEGPPVLSLHPQIDFQKSSGIRCYHGQAWVADHIELGGTIHQCISLCETSGRFGLCWYNAQDHISSIAAFKLEFGSELLPVCIILEKSLIGVARLLDQSDLQSWPGSLKRKTDSFRYGKRAPPQDESSDFISVPHHPDDVSTGIWELRASKSRVSKFNLCLQESPQTLLRVRFEKLDVGVCCYRFSIQETSMPLRKVH